LPHSFARSGSGNDDRNAHSSTWSCAASRHKTQDPPLALSVPRRNNAGPRSNIPRETRKIEFGLCNIKTRKMEGLRPAKHLKKHTNF
jgi:hypothetical protein